MGQVLYQSFRLIFGTLYPAYCSFKAVKTKNVKVRYIIFWQQKERGLEPEMSSQFER